MIHFRFVFMLLFSVIAGLCLSSNSAQAAVYTVWADSTADGAKDLILGTINGYQANRGSVSNYRYFSASGHPISGPNTTADRLKIFMYTNLNNGRDFFNIIGHRDNATGRHSYSADIRILGSILDPTKRIGDENRELVEVVDDVFAGNWSMRRNSDGGVIGPLTGTSWEIQLQILSSTFNRHVFASDGTSNIRFDNLNYSTYFITPGQYISPAIPEPTTFALFGLGVMGLIGYRRFKK